MHSIFIYLLDTKFQGDEMERFTDLRSAYNAR